MTPDDVLKMSPAELPRRVDDLAVIMETCEQLASQDRDARAFSYGECARALRKFQREIL